MLLLPHTYISASYCLEVDPGEGGVVIIYTMKNYELLCVLPGTLSDEEVTPVIANVVSIIEENGGSNVKKEDRGKSRLAYPMKHIRYGYVHIFTFEAETASIPAIQAKLRLESSLLRAMINVFDPAMREEKKQRLAKLALEKTDIAPKVEEPKVEAVEKTVEADGTDKPTEQNMEEIAKKLDKVLDSAIGDI